MVGAMIIVSGISAVGGWVGVLAFSYYQEKANQIQE